MGMLEYFFIKTKDDEFHIKTEIHKSKNFQTLTRKLKDENVVGLIQIDEGEFMAFIEE